MAESQPLVGNTTVTAGKVGPGASATTQRVNNCRKVVFDMMAQVVSFQDAVGHWSELDYANQATVTVTISGATTTFTFSS